VGLYCQQHPLLAGNRAKIRLGYLLEPLHQHRQPQRITGAVSLRMPGRLVELEHLAISELAPYKRGPVKSVLQPTRKIPQRM
jgi:hypothetical protein